MQTTASLARPAVVPVSATRSAQVAGLCLGTWPLAITHASRGGSIGSDAWQQAAGRYLAKWGD